MARNASVAAEGAVKITLEKAFKILRSAPADNPIMFWGPPGVGKTSVIRAVAAERGAVVHEEYLSTRAPEDLEGVPFAREIEGDLFTLFAPPARFADLVAKNGPEAYLFLDEINTAQPHIQVLAMAIALERRLGSVKMRNNVRIVAAGNRAADRAAVTPMPKPLENRFEHYEIVPDVDVWVRWALPRGIDPTIIGFVRAGGLSKLLDFDPDNPSPAFPSPRSWEMAHRRVEAQGWDDGDIQAALSGCVGEGTAVQLLAFRRLRDELPNVEDILKDGKKAEIPSQPDRAYFVLTALTAHLFKECTDKQMVQALHYITRMNPEMGAKFFRDILLSKNAARVHLFPAFKANPDLSEAYEKKWAGVLKHLNGGN